MIGWTWYAHRCGNNYYFNLSANEKGIFHRSCPFSWIWWVAPFQTSRILFDKMVSCPSSRCKELFVATSAEWQEPGKWRGISLHHLAGLPSPPPRSIPVRLLHLPSPTCRPAPRAEEPMRELVTAKGRRGSEIKGASRSRHINIGVFNSYLKPWGWISIN